VAWRRRRATRRIRLRFMQVPAADHGTAAPTVEVRHRYKPKPCAGSTPPAPDVEVLMRSSRFHALSRANSKPGGFATGPRRDSLVRGCPCQGPRLSGAGPMKWIDQLTHSSRGPPDVGWGQVSCPAGDARTTGVSVQPQRVWMASGHRFRKGVARAKQRETATRLAVSTTHAAQRMPQLLGGPVRPFRVGPRLGTGRHRLGGQNGRKQRQPASQPRRRRSRIHGARHLCGRNGWPPIQGVVAPRTVVPRSAAPRFPAREKSHPRSTGYRLFFLRTRIFECAGPVFGIVAGGGLRAVCAARDRRRITNVEQT